LLFYLQPKITSQAASAAVVSLAEGLADHPWALRSPTHLKNAS